MMQKLKISMEISREISFQDVNANYNVNDIDDRSKHFYFLKR
jgi:hypothetical protein